MLKGFFQIVALTVVGLTALAIYVFKPNGDIAAFIQHPATAPWAQAIGGLLAVAAAVTVSIEETRARERDRLLAIRERHRSARTIARTGADYLVASLVVAARRTREGTWVRGEAAIVKADVKGAAGILRAVPLQDLVEPDMSAAVLNGLQAANAALILLSEVEGRLQHFNPPPTATYFDSILEGARDVQKRLNNRVREVAAGRE